jgi:hypothetical protein
MLENKTSEFEIFCTFLQISIEKINRRECTTPHLRNFCTQRHRSKIWIISKSTSFGQLPAVNTHTQDPLFAIFAAILNANKRAKSICPQLFQAFKRGTKK